MKQEWARREQKKPSNFETTFDVDGKIQTNNGQLEKKKTRPPEVLPATLEFKEAGK